MKIVILEDVPEEAEWVERELRKAGLSFTSRQVQTKEQFTRAVEEFAAVVTQLGCYWLLINKAPQ
jgi:two-component system sensor kinase